MRIIKRVYFSILLLLVAASWNYAKAQYPSGATGLLTIPSADMQSDGTFMSGVNYMPSRISPEAWSYDTANYFFNITLLPFFEVNYLCTLCKLNNGTINQDRALILRLRLLEESSWYPSILLGSGDAMSLSQDNLNPLDKVDGNRYYGGVYGVATKHFTFADHIIGLTVGYNHKTQESSYKDGVFYGLSYQPAICPEFKLMADLNCNVVSVGGAVKLFKRISAYGYCYDFKAFAGGVRYEVKLY